MSSRHSTQKPISTIKIVVYSILASFSVWLVGNVVQWVYYDDWLHGHTPLHFFGTSLAALVTFWSVLRWQVAVRARHGELIHRLEVIADINDRVRNQLQAIECLTYAADPSVTESVRTAVANIEAALHGVIEESTAELSPGWPLGTRDTSPASVPGAAARSTQNGR